MAGYLEDLLTKLMDKWPTGGDTRMEIPPLNSGESAGRVMSPDDYMKNKSVASDPKNIFDELGKIVDYDPGKGGGPFANLLSDGGNGPGTISGFISRMLSPTPERNNPDSVQGYGKVGGGDPLRGTPGTGIDPGLDPTPSKNQRAPAFKRTDGGENPSAPLTPSVDYSMPAALNPQQIEELRLSLLTQAGQLDPNNPNGLAGRMSGPNASVDQHGQMNEAQQHSDSLRGFDGSRSARMKRGS